MADPKVSIVLPNHNYAHFLDERITTLLDQTFTDFELIIVDDGSSDNSRDVIQKYCSDARIKTLWFETNSGTVFQRWNASLARGDYLMFAGADDSCSPTLLQTLVRLLDENPDVGVACSQSWETDASSKRVRIKQQKPRWSTDFIIPGSEEAPYLLTEPTVQNASAALFRRKLVEEVGGLDMSVGICADWMMFAKIMRHSNLAYVAEPLNCYRKHDRTVRATKRKGYEIWEKYRVVDFVLKSFELPARAQDDALDWLANLWISKVLMLGLRGELKQYSQIHQVARSVDPALYSRLQRLLLTRATGRIKRNIVKLLGR